MARVLVPGDFARSFPAAGARALGSLPRPPLVRRPSSVLAGAGFLCPCSPIPRPLVRRLVRRPLASTVLVRGLW